MSKNTSEALRKSFGSMKHHYRCLSRTTISTPMEGPSELGREDETQTQADRGYPAPSCSVP